MMMPMKIKVMKEFRIRRKKDEDDEKVEEDALSIWKMSFNDLENEKKKKRLR